MSLFEDDRYRWRETYFVLFRQADRPLVSALEQRLADLGDRYQIRDLRTDERGALESISLLSPYDNAAMDITYVAGDEVVEQVKELLEQFTRLSLTADEREKARLLPGCDARFDIYHFEEASPEDGDDDTLDPGTLLIVLEQLADVCRGVAVDPQAGCVV